MKSKLLALSVVLAFNAGAAFAGPDAPSGDFGAEHAYPQGVRGYEAGTTVSNVGRKFECKEFPNSGYCIQYSDSANQYEPGVGSAWEMAWTEIKVEKATYDYDFMFPIHQSLYKAGVIVNQNGTAYKCKPAPYDGYCSQGSFGSTEYDPQVGHAWDQAWTELGAAGQIREGM